MDHAAAVKTITQALHGPYDYPSLEYEHEGPGVVVVLGYRQIDTQQALDMLETHKYTFEAVYCSSTRTRLGVATICPDDSSMKNLPSMQPGPIPIRIYPEGHRFPEDPDKSRLFSNNTENAADVRTKWPHDANSILAVLDIFSSNVPLKAGKQTKIETTGTTIDIKVAIDYNVPGYVFEALRQHCADRKVPLTGILLTHNHIIVRLVAHNTAPTSASEMRREDRLRRRKRVAPY
jgi:hypothetical protein